MQVLLTQDYPQLGQKGHVVSVKAGYFRNYLMPKALARLATAIDVERHDKQEEVRIQQRQEMMSQAEKMAGKLNGQTIKLKEKASESGSLYSQVHEMEVAKMVCAQFDCAISATDVKFASPVKKVGEYQFSVRLTSDHKADMTLVVEAADAE